MKTINNIDPSFFQNETFSSMEDNAVISSDIFGRIVFCNEAAELLLGYRTKELLNVPLNDIVPKQYRDLYIKGFMRASEKENCEEIVEFEVIRQDGRELPVELTLIYMSHGDKNYFTAKLKDISEKEEPESVKNVQQAESSDAVSSELLEKYEKLKKIFNLVEVAKYEWEKSMDCVKDMLFLVDEQGKIKRCNRTFKDFTEKNYQDILGRSWVELFSEQDIPVDILDDKVEIYHKRTQKWFLIESIEKFDERSGKTTIVTIRDTTQINIIAEELKEKNIDLENAYKKLKVTQAKMLQQEKLTSIGQLAAGVAHEINNPMGFISSNLGMLEKYASRLISFINLQTKTLHSLVASEKLVEVEQNRKNIKLDYICDDIKGLILESQDGANRIKAIVQNLKDFSRVDAAEYEYANINNGLDSTVSVMRNDLKDKIVVNKNYGDIPMVKCYAQQLNMVFKTFMDNARQAIEDKGEITLRTWYENSYIYFSVKDTGCGISNNDINRIFEPFFTTREVGKGTGLGLSIAYDIIQKHKGDIKVKSDEGKGTLVVARILAMDIRDIDKK